VASGTLIEDRVTARVADLCNGLYEVMLQVLSRYYVHHGETPAELETLARTAKHHHVPGDEPPADERQGREAMTEEATVPSTAVKR
jgi:hypothetical protein